MRAHIYTQFCLQYSSCHLVGNTQREKWSHRTDLWSVFEDLHDIRRSWVRSMFLSECTQKTVSLPQPPPSKAKPHFSPNLRHTDAVLWESIRARIAHCPLPVPFTFFAFLSPFPPCFWALNLGGRQNGFSSFLQKVAQIFLLTVNPKTSGGMVAQVGPKITIMQ